MYAIILLLSIAPHKTAQIITDVVDVAELNHYYDPQTGRQVFDQVIWYSWNHSESRYEVVDWRLLKGVRDEVTPEQITDWRNGTGPDECEPQGCWRGGHATPMRGRNGKYESFWEDEKSGMVMRRVIANQWFETWTNYDPEQQARNVIPQDKRKMLTPRRRGR